MRATIPGLLLLAAASPALAFGIATARVVSVFPNYREISVPRRQCWAEEVVEPGKSMAGAIVGDRLDNSGPTENVRTAERCRTVHETERREDGYDVVYEYAGQRFQARMRRDPGEAVTVHVRPSVIE